MHLAKREREYYLRIVSVPAEIQRNIVVTDPQIGNTVGECRAEVKELKDDSFRVEANPNGRDCSKCPIKRFCSVSMDGYL